MNLRIYYISEGKPLGWDDRAGAHGLIWDAINSVDSQYLVENYVQAWWGNYKPNVPIYRDNNLRPGDVFFIDPENDKALFTLKKADVKKSSIARAIETLLPAEFDPGQDLYVLPSGEPLDIEPLKRLGFNAWQGWGLFNINISLPDWLYWLVGGAAAYKSLSSGSLVGKLGWGAVSTVTLGNLYNKKNAVGEIGAMKKHRYIPVYTERPREGKRGKSNLGFAKDKSGVYLIKENGKIVYVGQSQNNLYRTITRHFQDWNDRRSPDRVTYRYKMDRNRYTVRIVFVSPSRALKLEEMLIKRHRPRDNAAKLHEIESFTPTKGMENVLEEYEESYTDEVPF